MLMASALKRLDYGLEVRELRLNSRQGKEFLFDKTSTSVLAPNQHYINWHRGIFLQGWGGQDVELITDIHLVPD